MVLLPFFIVFAFAILPSSSPLLAQSLADMLRRYANVIRTTASRYNKFHALVE